MLAHRCRCSGSPYLFAEAHIELTPRGVANAKEFHERVIPVATVERLDEVYARRGLVGAQALVHRVRATGEALRNLTVHAKISAQSDRLVRECSVECVYNATGSAETHTRGVRKAPN